MAKKSKKIEKETRKLMEAISDLVKVKGDRYKFKSKNKKQIKKIKKTCVHWIFRKGKEMPTVVQDPNKPGYWKCSICGASFPIRPYNSDEYNEICTRFLEMVNQLQFWSVKLGGDADDTKMFIKLKELTPRVRKVAKQIIKRVNQRQSWEENRKKSSSLAQFGSYSGFNYSM